MNFKLEYQADGRPSWDHYFIRLAETVSLRADCLRAQVGAVLVMADHHTIYVGYNGTVPSEPGCLMGHCPRGLKTYEEVAPYSDYSDCIGIHAESNALMSCLRNNGQPKGAVIYVTRQPCDDCISMMKSYSVARAFWSEGYMDLSLPKMG